MKEHEVYALPRTMDMALYIGFTLVGGVVVPARFVRAIAVLLLSLLVCSSAFADTKTIAVGQSAKISVTADGTQPFTYQWYKNGVAISGATLADYTTPVAAAVTSVSEQYYAKVTNAVGSVDSDVSYLTVKEPSPSATITTNPVPLTVSAGQPATFSVAATGSGILSYQWNRGGVAITGATRATYTISSATAANEGSYSVSVINTVGDAPSLATVSSSASLTVSGPAAPTISTQPAAKAVTAGSSASFSVVATGSGTLSYQWSKDGTVISGATAATYTISPVAITHAGSYSVAVINTVNSVVSTATVSSPAALTVTPASPTITAQSGAQSVVLNSSVTFSVTASGSGVLSYQWRKDGVPIAGATSSSFMISGVTSGHSGSYTVQVTATANSLSSVPTTSSAAFLTVTAAPVAPTISAHPVGKSAVVGETVSLSVTASGTASLTYQWKMDNAVISGATAATYTIPSVATTHAGSYTVTVANSVGSVTSNAAVLAVVAFAAPKPDGFASSATGGAAGSMVMVTTAAEFISNAEATAARVITVKGSLNLGTTSVKVKSNKTIQGFDKDSTLVGCLEMSGGVSNVIIRGLHITNSAGDGITIQNASNIFITHCTLFNCSSELIEISTGADNVTVSWSEFYYTAAQATHRASLITGAGSETKPLRVTLHHNYWSDLCDTSMPSGSYGYVHLFNNYFKSPGNASGTVASDNAQFFAEYNSYDQVKDPLYKENVNTAQAAGRIRSIGNAFSTCTGKAGDVGADAIFTPTYTYNMLPVAQVHTACLGLAGNNAGAASESLTGYGAAIWGPADLVATATRFTLTAQPNGYIGTSFQWRLNNFDIVGETSASYTVSSAQEANTGVYTVVIGRSSGDFVVSSPLTIALGTPGKSNSSNSGVSAAASTGGGGGAPSVWYLVLIAVLAVARARRKVA